jgi:hypothetical protein
MTPGMQTHRILWPLVCLALLVQVPGGWTPAQAGCWALRPCRVVNPTRCVCPSVPWSGPWEPGADCVPGPSPAPWSPCELSLPDCGGPDWVADGSVKAPQAPAAPVGAKFFSPGVEPFDTGHATSFLQWNVPVFTGRLSPASLASGSGMGGSAAPATLGLSAAETFDLGATLVANGTTSSVDLSGLLSGSAPFPTPLSPLSPQSRLLSATVATPEPASLSLAGLGLVGLMAYLSLGRLCSRIGAVTSDRTALRGTSRRR